MAPALGIRAAAWCKSWFALSCTFYIFFPVRFLYFLYIFSVPFLVCAVLWTNRVDLDDIARERERDFGRWYIFRGILPFFSFLPLIHPLFLSLSFPIIPKHPKLLNPTNFQRYSSIQHYRTFQAFPPFNQPRSSISSSYISNTYLGFLLQPLSPAALMSLSFFDFKCNAVNFFCCTWQITRTSERNGVHHREAPITTQPTPQEPMNANPRGLPLR